jgi:hypothetical protein
LFDEVGIEVEHEWISPKGQHFAGRAIRRRPRMMLLIWPSFR